VDARSRSPPAASRVTLKAVHFRVPGLALAAALVTAVSCSAAAKAAPLPGDFFGVSSPELINLSPAQRAPILADQRAAGVRLLRQLFDWSQIEATKGSYSWDSADSLMASSARAGMEVLPVVLYSPTWASSCPSYSSPKLCPPADFGDFADFFVKLIGRYGPSGTFWSDNPTVPKMPITAWQVWNEPNFPAYWGTPDAAAYARMLNTVAPAIRAADPHAEVVSAGMPDSLVRTAVRLVPYVTALYANGAKGSFDALALHIYDDTPDDAVGLVEQVRAIMNANGDNSVPIWVTEWGWASAGAPSRFATDLAGQAANVDALMGTLVARHEELDIRGLVEYLWHDGSPQSDTSQGWPYHLGLVFQDYTHKPSYDAYLGRAIHTDPPETTITLAPTGTVTPGPEGVAFQSSEAGSDFECSVDGGAFAACATPYDLGTPAIGIHTFRVRATDPYGNVDPSPALAAWAVAVPPPVYDPALVQTDAHAVAHTLGKLDLRKLAHKTQVALRLSWPGPGTITVALTSSGKTIGRGAATLTGPGKGSLNVRFTSFGRRLIKRGKRMRVVLNETFDPSIAGSNTVTSTAVCILKAKRSRR
jgi:hypothetical protein